MSLSETQARRNSGALKLAGGEVRLDLRSPSDGFGYTCALRFGTDAPGTAHLSLDRAGLRRLSLDQVDIDADHESGPLPLTLEPGPHLIRAVGDGRFSDDGRGLVRWSDPETAETVLYTHLQPDAAHRLFPCFDQPDLKAPWRLSVALPAGWEAVSCMPAAVATPGYRAFETTPPLSTYLLAVVTGDIGIAAETEVGSYPVRVWTRRSLRDRPAAASVADEAAAILAYLISQMDHPPLSVLNLCAVPQFADGAMENLGCVVFDERFLDTVTSAAAQARRREMLAHELSHQWFGNTVTPRWWDDLWLNEGVATWTAQTVLDHLWPDGPHRILHSLGKKADALERECGSDTHPVSQHIDSASAAMDAFDAVTYAKGAALVPATRGPSAAPLLLGDIGELVTRRRYTAIDRREFLADLAAESGRPDADSAPWLRAVGTAGAAVFTEDHRGGELRLVRGADTVCLPARIDLAVLVPERSGWTESSATVSPPPPGGSLSRPLAPGSVVVMDASDRTYLRSVPCPATLETLSTASVPPGTGIVAAVLWRNVALAALSGESDARLAAHCLGAAPTRHTDADLLRWLARTRNRLMARRVPSRWARERGWPDWETRLLAIAESATGETRVAAVQALADSRLSPGSIALFMRRLESTSEVESGVATRWRIARSLVAHGAMTPQDALHSVAASPNDPIGARLMAAEPTAPAMRRAIRRSFDPAVGSAIRFAVSESAQLAGVERRWFIEPAEFFTALDDLWRRVGGHQARVIADRVYPWRSDDEPVVPAGLHPAAARAAADLTSRARAARAAARA
ncbi:MAG: M1 family aminopeptidase [Nocardioides sp.]